MPIVDPEDMLPDRWKNLSPEQQKTLIREIKYNWTLWARDNQLVDWKDDDWDILLVLAGRGFGKLSPTTSVIATWDRGFKTLGDLVIGDIIFDEAGQPTRVLATFDATPSKAYRLHFSDGTYADSCDEHQWVTWTHRDRKAFGRMDRKNRTGDRPSAYPENWPQWRDSIPKDRWGNDRPLDVPVGPAVRTTQDIVDTITYGKRGDSNHSIPLTGPLNIPHDDSLLLDPYILGVWLGDGTSASGGVTIGPEDQVEMRKALAAVGADVGPVYSNGKGQTILGIQGHLREIGVLNNKHVPHDYLWASEAQRLSLLQGLMDSDGFCHADSGHVEFCNMNRQLADSVVFLARSLGQKPVLTTGRAMLNGVDHGEKYRVNWRPTIPVFRLPRKLARIRPAGNQSMRNQHRMIVGCEEIDPVPMRCLTVDSPNSMYLIGEALIPTHNTRMGAEAVREFCKANPGARVAITAPTYGSARDVCFEGDALAIDTEILTDRGWTTMGEIRVGDRVYAPDGTLTPVTWKSEIEHGRRCYEVEFFGGQKIVADANHKWQSLRYQRCRWRDLGEVLTTDEVAASTWPRAVPWAKALQAEDVELPIDPYVLGYWLGDGTAKASEITTRDEDVLRHIKEVGYDVVHRAWSDNGLAATYSIDPVGHQRWSRETSLLVALRTLGVHRNKHIPEQYLQGSIEQRMELLRGLLDSDGDITERGQVSFGNANRRLIDGVVELCAGLGIRIGSVSNHGKKYAGCQDMLRVSFTPASATERYFWVERKQCRVVDAKRNRYNRMRVTEADSVPVRCIGVAHPSSCYLVTRRFVVTHNSGLLEVSSPEEIDKAAGGKYNRSLGQLKYTNGSLCQWYSGGDPERFRGPQHHLIWADELCAWEKAQDTWDMMLMGLRLGAHPRIIITTTPKPSPLIIELVKRANEGDKRVKIVTGSTFDNSANLPSSALDALRARYEGTSLGRQELYAELILDSPGALWSREAIEINRVRMYDYDAEGNELSTGDVPDMNRIVVAVDPAMSAKGDRVAETGIVVAGVGSDGHGYVLEDATMENATPDQWANKAVEMYHKWQADKIVYEKNQGGDLIRHTFQTIDDRLPLKWVVASKGKALRAEPVSALYEQGRVHHVGNFPALEDQMAFWDPNEGNNRTNSPDRVDALVWAFTELMLHGGGGEVSVPWATSDDSGGSGGAWGGYAIPRM